VKDSRDSTRRELLGVLVAAAGSTAIACARRDADEPLRPGQVALELASLNSGDRVHVTVAGNPVEVIRVGDEVTARSLRCTHTGCTVSWREDVRQYVCPCHDGRFGEDGEVIAGPPPRPLRAVAVTKRKGRVVLGE
jgi:cytochrome b6-f complex iron-sulfur subunit